MSLETRSEEDRIETSTNNDMEDNSSTTNSNVEDMSDNKESSTDTKEEVINALRIQLEYYFSFENLCKDTFLCSIMSSNFTETDLKRNGGVQHSMGRHAPIVMLARFGKVKKIVNPNNTVSNNVQNYLKEAALSSDLLEVVPLNGSELLGIGPKIGSPLPYQSDYVGTNQPNVVDLNAPLPSTTVRRNTVILREMPASATQEQVEAVFSWEGCPQVKSVHPDVANCWFVTFQATEEEVVSVLLKLRNMKFEGQSIKARLKPQSSVKPTLTLTLTQKRSISYSSTNSNSDGTTNENTTGTNTTGTDAPNRSSNRNGYRNQTNYNPNPNRPYTRPRTPPQQQNKRSNNQNKQPATTTTPSMPPPQFHDSSNFPSLSSTEKPSEEKQQTLTDNNNAAVTGYAAALLKASTAPITLKKSSPTISATPKDTKKHIKATDRIPNKTNPTTPKLDKVRVVTPTGQPQDDGSNRTATTDEKSSISSASDNNGSIETSSSASIPTPVPSIKWSGKKSFADILKKQQLDAQLGAKH